MGLIIALFAVGIILLLAEMLLIPGIGVAGVLGLASLGGSCYYGFYHYGVAGGTIVTAVCVILIICFIVYSLRAKTWKRLSLDAVIGKNPAETASLSVGDRGSTLTRLAPAGTARIGDVTCEVHSVDGIVNPGTDVEVVSVRDGRVSVKPIVDTEQINNN